MALIKIGLSSPSTNTAPKKNLRDEFEERLERIPGIRTKQEPLKKYRSWKIFCNYIFIRTYPTKLTIHTNGDIDHYEMKEVLYQDIPLNVSDIEFLHLILTDFKKKV